MCSNLKKARWDAELAMTQFGDSFSWFFQSFQLLENYFFRVLELFNNLNQNLLRLLKMSLRYGAITKNAERSL